MEAQIAEMQQTIEKLTLENAELKAWKQEHNSAKQSVGRMSSRLRKLCKRLEPTTEIVTEMQKIADEIRQMAKIVSA